MIPVSLNLRNFMSYTDVHEPLQFEGIHVAVLSGENGHGKSALLDAVTWALWGASRAKSVDDLIHTGATDMEVEFEFILDDQQYRVIRKRQRKGKTGVSDLQFAALSDGVYRALTERSVSETEQAIRRTLKMSYETFVNSAFIQQGRADSFTTKPPAERKQILAEILDLGYYDLLESRSREAYREREARVREERARATDWEREVAQRPEYAAELERLSGELAVLEERVRSQENACKLARERVARLEEMQRALEAIGDRLRRYAGDLDRGRKRLAEVAGRLAEAERVLVRSAEIERGVQEFTAARQVLQEAERKLATFRPLERTRDSAQAALDRERARLEAHLTALVKQVTELQPIASRRATLEVERKEAAEALERLAGLDRDRDAFQARATQCREQAAEKRAENRRFKEDMVALRARMDELETLTTCPACQRPMDTAHKDRLRTAYQAEGEALKTRYRGNERECNDLEAVVAQHDLELARMAEALSSRAEAQKQAAAAESALAQAATAETRLATVQRELTELEGILAERRYAPEARLELDLTEQRMLEIGYDEAAHAAARKRVADLESADVERQNLEKARQAAEHLRDEKRALDDTLRRLDEEVEVDRRRHESLQAEAASYAAERKALEYAEDELARGKQERDRARDSRTQVQGKLDWCAFVERKLAASLAEQDALKREQGVYAELASAFGKKGLQAMIIDTAIPEIEEEANRLLARMTDGRMHVKLETQRDARSGSGTIETLDIRIADELGTRNYEMFSGGEGFRVNFALRVALSKLLARRAGTKLQTLVVDEGFGSQDTEGRDRIVEAIQAIQSEFEKILVITHLEDLRDRFPVRIDVEKTPHGSRYTLR